MILSSWFLALAAAAGAALLALILLNAKRIFSLLGGGKKKAKDEEVSPIPPPPPDLDPKDEGPLPRKFKINSFACYFGPDLDKVLPEITGMVDLLIVSPPDNLDANKGKNGLKPVVPIVGPKRLGNVASGVNAIRIDLEQPGVMVEPCLGMTEDGDLIILEDDAIVNDTRATKKANYDVFDPKVESQGTSLLLAQVDLNVFIVPKKSVFELNVRKYVRDLLLNHKQYNGVLYKGLEDAAHHYGGDFVSSVINNVTLQHREAIFMVQEGAALFDQVADYINGVVLVNPTLYPNGRHRPRFYGEETEKFDSFMAKLNTEIAIRNDFVTLAMEVVRNYPSAELQANFQSWVEGLGFVGWISADPLLASLQDIKPLKLNIVKGGIMGMLDFPEVKDYYARADAFTAKGKELAPANAVPLPGPEEWRNFLNSSGAKNVLDFVSSLESVDYILWQTVNLPQNPTHEPSLDNLPPNPDFRPWPSANTRGQRPIGEYRLDTRKEDQLLVSLSFLQAEGHLKNIADTITLETVPKSFDQYENNVVSTSDPSFIDLNAVVGDIVNRPSAAVLAIINCFEPERLKIDLVHMMNGLEKGNVRVWIADKRAFFFKNDQNDRAVGGSVTQQISEQTPNEIRYLAVYEDNSNETNIYIASDHPSIPEAVVHCYFSSRGYTHSQCLVLESLIRAQKEVRDASKALNIVPRRVEWQLESSSYEELAEFIMNSRSSARRLDADGELNDSQKKVLKALCLWVLRKSRSRLLDEITDNLSDMQHVADMMLDPATDVERQLTDLLGQATIRAGATNLFLQLLGSVGRAMNQAGTNDSRARLLYIHRLIHNAFQRIALKELALKVMQKNPLPLPEEDQITVGIEMQVSRDKIKSLFGLSSNQLGGILYRYLRAKVVRAEIIGGNTEKKEEKLDVFTPAAYMKRLASGMFFTIPALIDVVLILFVGSGVFSSDQMGAAAVDVVNLSFLIVFATMGGVMNSIARVCAYYFSQYSVPLMLAGSVRRFVAGLMFAFFFSLVALVVISIIHSPLWGLLAFAYTLTFSIFVMLMASLFVMQTGTEFVLKSAGPRAVGASLVMLLIPCVVVLVIRKGVQLDIPFDPVFIYYGILVVATVFLAVSFKQAAAEWINWPNSIHITKVADIEKLYATVVAKPKRRDGESLTDHGKREKRWERRARQYFMMLVEGRLKKQSMFSRQRKLKGGDPYQIVEDRIKQENKEKILMEWYLMRTGQAHCPYASFQWDVLLKQALGDIKKKFSVEKLNRGGLLFDFEAQSIAFGWMYFFMIFIDRWVTILSGNGIFLYIADSTISNNYAFGVGCATIFMLVSAGTFELNLSSISYAESHWESSRLGLHDKYGLLTARKKQKRKFYFAELRRFLTAVLMVFVVTTGLVLGLGYTREVEAIKYYIIGCGGYLGLLVGLFHKLFLTDKDASINKCLLAGCVLGLAGGLGMVVGFKDPMYAIFSLVIGSWVFGISCFFLQRRNLEVHRGVTLSPSLMSSGQTWIAPDGLANEGPVRDKVLEPLVIVKANRLKIRPEDAIGRRAIEILEECGKSYRYLPGIIKAAFPSGEQTLNVICDGLRQGRLKVYMVLESSLAIDSTQGYSALSEYDPEKDKLRVYIATPSNVGAEMMTRIVAEAIVHEYMESFGMSHYHAVISELLLDGESRLPHRISYQLANMTGNALLAVSSNFGSMIFREACLLVNMSTHWTKVPASVRGYIVDYLEAFYDIANSALVSGKLDLDSLPFADDLNFEDVQEYMRVVGATSDELIESPKDILRVYVARSCLGYELVLRVNEIVDVMLSQTSSADFVSEHDQLEDTFAEDIALSYSQWAAYRMGNFLRLLHSAMTADPRFGRELHFGHAMPAFLTPVLPLIYWLAQKIHLVLSLNFLWCSKKMDHFLSRTRAGLNREHFIEKGRMVSVKYYDTEVPVTAFVQPQEKPENPDQPPMMIVNHYDGLYTTPPKGNPLVVSEYQFVQGLARPILVKQFLSKGARGKPATAFYHYEDKSPYPACCFMYYGKINKITDANDRDRHMTLMYDPKSGNVAAATLYCRNGSETREIEAQYMYEDEGIISPMVRAVYTDPVEGWTMTVQYAGSVRGEDKPHIAYVDYMDARRVKYRTHYSYTHPLHPTMQTMKLRTGNIAHRKVKVETPSVVKNDTYGLIEHMPPRSIYHYDLLQTHKMKRKKGGLLRSNYCVQFFARPATTQFKRMELWTLWRSGHIEGVYAMDIDELFLREESILQNYWRHRDNGALEEAAAEIKEKMVQISNLVVQDTPNTRTHLQMRIADLQNLGCGGDASEITTVDSANEEINREILQVLSVDSGTWPTGGGGVGSCRRDLIDNLERVRWTAIAEIGTDSEMVQKGFQAERYVNAIHYVPLWGLDMGTPNQHVLSDQPYGELQLKKQRTTDDVVRRNFVPLVKQMIHGMCQTNFQPHHQKLYADMFVKLHLYFQEFDWLTSWDHEDTKVAWYNTWFTVLTDCWTSDTKDERLLQLEMPTLEDLDALFQLIVRLLFPLAARLPRLAVVHASHHGIQSLLGVIAKTLYGSSLIIWDHGILWRERLLALSSLPPSVMPKFVQIGFSGLTRLSATLAYMTANCVCPCTSIQNVQWEIFLGGGKYGNNSMVETLVRKISPVLNGMDVNRFRINKALERDLPTTVMLSHVNRIKDVMNAIEAAAVIVHEYKLKEYQLLVYGSLESDPIYANECANAIVALNLAENVTLCGLGNPSQVLPAGWVFVNSSISEGLPLAIGEAGLCGLPVVCTDVGGSREVLSDTIPGQPIDPMLTYGRIVPPRSSSDLAVAQMEIFGMMNGVERIVDANCKTDVTLDSLKDDPAKLLARMMDPLVKAKRRRLGLLLRSRVYKVFPISRYLREHEQQMWIAALQCEHWDLWQMVQRYVMPRRRIATRRQEVDEVLPLTPSFVPPPAPPAPVDEAKEEEAAMARISAIIPQPPKAPSVPGTPQPATPTHLPRSPRLNAPKKPGQLDTTGGRRASEDMGEQMAKIMERMEKREGEREVKKEKENMQQAAGPQAHLVKGQDLETIMQLRAQHNASVGGGGSVDGVEAKRGARASGTASMNETVLSMQRIESLTMQRQSTSTSMRREGSAGLTSSQRDLAMGRQSSLRTASLFRQHSGAPNATNSPASPRLNVRPMTDGVPLPPGMTRSPPRIRSPAITGGQ